MDGRIEQFRFPRLVPELPIFLLRHGKYPQIPCLLQHFSHADLAANLLVVFRQGQRHGQQVLGCRTAQPDGHLSAGEQHADQLVRSLTASDIHLVPPPSSSQVPYPLPQRRRRGALIPLFRISDSDPLRWVRCRVWKRTTGAEGPSPVDAPASRPHGCRVPSGAGSVQWFRTGKSPSAPAGSHD